MQARGDGRGEIVEAGEFGRRWSTPCRFAPWGREGDPAAAVEFGQQSSGGHAFQPSGVGAPVPCLSEFLGETTTMPVRMGSDQVPDIDEVLLRESAALNTQRSLHRPKGSMNDTRESSGILSGNSVRGASKDLSSYHNSHNASSQPPRQSLHAMQCLSAATRAPTPICRLGSARPSRPG